MKNVFRCDRGELRSPIRTEEGYILADGYFARPGVLEYRDASGNVFRELIPEEELHRADSLSTMGRKPVTYEHPPELVNKDNVATYGCGDTDSEITIADNGYVKVRLAIRRADLIDAVERGDAVELSPGYFCDLDVTPGVHEKYGAYDAIQRNRRYNHLASVGLARGGRDIRLRTDSEDVILVDLQKSNSSTSMEEESVVENIQESKEASVNADEMMKKTMEWLGVSDASAIEGAITTLKQPVVQEVVKTDSVFNEDLAIKYADERIGLVEMAKTYNVDSVGVKNSDLVVEIAKKIAPEVRTDASQDFYLGLIAGAKASPPKEEPILKFDGKIDNEVTEVKSRGYDSRLAKLQEMQKEA